MRSTRFTATLGLLSSLAVPLASMAQDQPIDDVTVTFVPWSVGGATAVPLGGWATAVLAIVLAALVALFWKKPWGHGLRSLALAGAVLAGLATAVQIGDVQADPTELPTVDLIATPTIVPIDWEDGENQRFSFRNATSGPIRITSIVVRSCYAEQEISPCSVGDILEVDGICTVDVEIVASCAPVISIPL